MVKAMCCILTFDPAKHAIPKMKWHILMANYGKKSCRQAWLTIWDKVKSHRTVTDWCTGREWPMNCMTVISTWWRSNMPFQGRRKWHIPMASYGGDIEWAIELLNSVTTRSQLVWRPDPLVARCGRGSQHPAEWVPGPLVEQHQENGKETLMAIRVEVNMLQFCSFSNFLSHTQPFQIKWEVYFFKEVF